MEIPTLELLGNSKLFYGHGAGPDTLIKVITKEDNINKMLGHWFGDGSVLSKTIGQENLSKLINDYVSGLSDWIRIYPNKTKKGIYNITFYYFEDTPQVTFETVYENSVLIDKKSELKVGISNNIDESLKTNKNIIAYKIYLQYKQKGKIEFNKFIE